MTVLTDLFKSIKFNDGEEIVYGDLDDSQESLGARLLDQILGETAPNNSTYGVEENETNGPVDIDGVFVYALRPGRACAIDGSNSSIALGTTGQVNITPGTILQKIGSLTGSEASLIPFTFDGTTLITIANGDASHPRVDLIQVKLEYLNAGAQNRVFNTAPLKADLDLDTITTHLDTIVRAKNPGRGGNSISIAIAKRSSGSGVTYSESGNAITIQYEDGVSTVANVETALAASTLIDIESAGTPGNVLHDPADTHAATHLVGGADQVLVSQSMNKARQIKCTISVKSGVAAVSPVYPTPDAGYAAMFGVVVPTTWAAASTLDYIDSAGTDHLVVHDLRMPMGRVREYHVGAESIFHDGTWTLLNGRLISTSGPAVIYAPCPAWGNGGRLIGVSIGTLNFPGSGDGVSGCVAKVGHFRWYNSFEFKSLVSLSNALNTTANILYRLNQQSALEFAPVSEAGPTVQRDATSAIASPIWTTGVRAPIITGLQGRTQVAVEIGCNTTVGAIVTGVVFYVAEGL